MIEPDFLRYAGKDTGVCAGGDGGPVYMAQLELEDL